MQNELIDSAHNFKVIFLGETGSGKSSIIQKICEKDNIKTLFNYNIEYGFRTHLINNYELKMYFFNLINSSKLNIFKYQEIRNFFFKDVHMIIIVFDLTDPTYVETISKWIHEVEREKMFLNNNNFKILCLGTKADLRPTYFYSYSETLSYLLASLSKKFKQPINYFEVNNCDNSCSLFMQQIEKYANIHYQELLYP